MSAPRSGAWRAATPDRRPPGPPRSAAPGLLVKMTRNRLTTIHGALARYGDAVRLPLGPMTLYVFNHPDHAKHVLTDNAENYHKGIGMVHARRAIGDGLLTSEGEQWREQRRAIQPAFQAKRLAAQADAIVEEAGRLVERFRAHEGKGPLDIRREMTALTLGVLGRTLLDTDLGAFGGLGSSFEAVQNQAMFELMTLSMVPMWLPLPGQLRFRRAHDELEEVVRRLVDDRRARPGGDADDVVSLLIRATGREADPRVGRRRMRDELVTLLLAGHETTASTLSWAFYLVDQHPQVWERLHAEAVEVFGGTAPTAERLRGLTYTTKVVQEAMRLYPPVWLLPRVAQAPDRIGGYDVPAGANVLICPYAMHRRPDLWDEPECFLPERFDADHASRNRYAYIPFGAGPRFCVGNNLGMMEATIVLAMVARELRLEKVPGYAVRGEPMLTLRVRGGLPMTVRSVT